MLTVFVGGHDRDTPYDPYHAGGSQPPIYYPHDNDGPKVLPPYTVAVGDRTTIYCNSESIQEKLSWRRVDGSPLPTGSRLNRNEGALVIERTTHEAAGFYECTVTENNYEYPISQTQLIVVELPSITFSPSMPLFVRSGDNVVIYCNVSGEQPIRVNWHNENHQPLSP